MNVARLVVKSRGGCASEWKLKVQPDILWHDERTAPKYFELFAYFCRRLSRECCKGVWVSAVYLEQP